MMAVIRSRIQVHLQKEKARVQSFPSNKRARVLNDLEQEEEIEGQADEVEIVEVTSEPEPIRVENGDSSDEEGGSTGEESEDKMLVDVFFNVETYCESLNTGRLEQAVEGDESDFSINDIL